MAQHPNVFRQGLYRRADMLGVDLLPKNGTFTALGFTPEDKPYVIGYQLNWTETQDLLNQVAASRGIDVKPLAYAA